MKRTWRLRIYLDSRQDLVIDETIKNLKILFPNNKINKIKFSDNGLYITLYSNNIHKLFPQHDDGLKSNRKIELTNEQKNIIDNNSLMKGLFHSDGSFYVATKKYPRYQFTNKLKNIINIFSECLVNNGINPKKRKMA